jgi:hypothetical protein
VSVLAHPVYKVTNVQFPVREIEFLFYGPRVLGLRIDSDFLAASSMGECYFYVAAWRAVKVR